MPKSLQRCVTSLSVSSNVPSSSRNSMRSRADILPSLCCRSHDAWLRRLLRPVGSAFQFGKFLFEIHGQGFYSLLRPQPDARHRFACSGLLAPQNGRTTFARPGRVRQMAAVGLYRHLSRRLASLSRSAAADPPSSRGAEAMSVKIWFRAGATTQFSSLALSTTIAVAQDHGHGHGEHRSRRRSRPR